MNTLMLIASLMVLGVMASDHPDNIPTPPIVGNADNMDLICPKICPALHAPVCATRNERFYQLFNNRCEMRMANCNRPRDMDSIKDLIEADLFWCTSEVVENLIEKLESLQLDLHTPACFRPCPQIFNPICVSNGVYRAVLPNDCLLDGVNCALEQYAVNKSSTPELYKVLRYGSCE